MKNPMQNRQIHSPGPPNQPHNAPPSGGQHSGGNQSGGGFPWGKVLAGCGCVSLLGIIAIAVVVYFVVDAGSKFAKETGITDIVEMAEKADETGASSGDGSKKRIEQQARKRKEEALDPKKIRAYVDAPLTKKDIREHHAFNKKWENSSAHKNWVVQFEKMKELDKEKDDSVAGGLKAVGQSAKWLNSVHDVMEAFDKQVRDSGGYEKYYGRMMRIGGVVAASDTITKANKKLKDPDSDAVAKRMIKERPEIAKQYKKNFAEAKKAIAEAEKRKKAGKEPKRGDMAAFAGMATIMQGPGTVALARMPEASFETWKKLSAKERKKLRDSLTASIAPGHWFGLFAVNPAGLLMTSYMAEMEELKSKK
jgi:hypothetical protein